MPGAAELIIIGLIIILLFGGKIAERFFRNLGDGIREMRKLKKEINDGKKTIETEINKIKEV